MTTTQITRDMDRDDIYQIVRHLEIAEVCKAKGVTEVEYLGTGEAEEGNINSRCTFWRLAGVGRVASTNGNAVWDSDEGFDELAGQCGVDLRAATPAKMHEFIRTDHDDGAHEYLQICRLPAGQTLVCADLDGAEYPFLVQVTAEPGGHGDFIGIYDLDGERLDYAQFSGWEIAEGDVPPEVTAQVLNGWEHGGTIVQAYPVPAPLGDAAEVAAQDPGLIQLQRWTCAGCGEHTSAPAWRDGSPYCEGCEAAPADPPDAPAYPVAVAREVAARRPDLVVGDSVSLVLTIDPRLSADEVIEVLDAAVAEASA